MAVLFSMFMPVTLTASNSERQQYCALWLLLCSSCEFLMEMNIMQNYVVMHNILISSQKQ